jgi:hypothetical protein
MLEKKCNKCGKTKAYTDFYKRGGGKIRTNCSLCYKKKYVKLSAAPESIYKKYKRSAKRRNLLFRLSFGDFKKFKDVPCRYCGAKLDRIRLDRIDNDLGYIPGNIDSCCYPCNSLKHVLDEKIFLNHVSAIYVYQNVKQLGLKDE